MKKIAVVFLFMLLLVVPLSFSEGLLPTDLSEGSRLIGLLITREDLSAYTGGSGVLPASSLQPAPDSYPEYLFGDVRGLRLICFMLPDASGEGSRIVSNVDDGLTDAYKENRCVKLQFAVSCDADTVKVKWNNTGDMPFTPRFQLAAGDIRKLCVECSLKSEE